jgi:hypothetical protein
LNPEGQIALGQPTVGDAELSAVAEVFRSGWLSGAGPTCRRFEERFSALAGTEHALATNNCGAALHLAMTVLDAGPGEVWALYGYDDPFTKVWSFSLPPDWSGRIDLVAPPTALPTGGGWGAGTAISAFVWSRTRVI